MDLAGTILDLASLPKDNRAASAEIFRRVKANQVLLDACPRHRFEDVDPGKAFNKHFVCAACGGIVNVSAYLWYQRGLEHAHG